MTREPAALPPPWLASPYVVAFRCWALEEGGELHSIHVAHVWTPGVNSAICKRGRPHRAPHVECECGLHANHQFNDAIPTFPMAVLGAVRAWGDVQIHSDEIRAQHAEVIALMSGGGSNQTEAARERMAARRYRVPLVGDSQTLKAIMTEHGQPVPAHLRPPAFSESEQLTEEQWFQQQTQPPAIMPHTAQDETAPKGLAHRIRRLRKHLLGPS